MRLPTVPHRLLALASLLVLQGCDEAEPRDAGSGPEQSSQNQQEAEPAVPSVMPIPLGEVLGGTLPGRFERDPSLEPTPFTLKLGPFAIDSHPYPNQPGQPPLLGSSREEASRLCGEAGARLCTELEWERACRGPEQHPFATGQSWDSKCQGQCRSPLVPAA